MESKEKEIMQIGEGKGGNLKHTIDIVLVKKGEHVNTPCIPL